jgi:hypothetical protein
MYASVSFSVVIIHVLPLGAFIAYIDVGVAKFDGTNKGILLIASEGLLSIFFSPELFVMEQKA